MRVDDKVRIGRVGRRPVFLAEKRILQHERDALIDLGNPCKNTVNPGIDPVRAIHRQTGWCGEASEVVRKFISWSYGEGPWTAARYDEPQNRIGGLEGVGEVRCILEPGVVSECFTDAEGIDTSGQGMEADDL